MDRRSALEVGATTLLTATAGCLALDSESTPEPGGGATDESPGTPTQTSTATDTATPEDQTATPTDDESEEATETPDDGPLWRQETPATVKAVVDGRVVCAATEGNNQLFALDAGTGERQWTYDREDGWYNVYHGFSVDDALYFGQASDNIGGEGTLYAIEFDGTERWRIETTGVQSVTVSESRIFAGIESTAVQAVNSDTGTERWRYNLASEHDWDPPGAPALHLAGETLYAAGDEIVALDPSGPNMSWSYRRDRHLRIGAITDSSLIVETSVGPAAIANGQERWLVEDGLDLLEITEELVITATDNGSVRAFDRDTGDKQWSTQLTKNRLSRVAYTPQLLYLVAGDTLFVIELADGTVAWQTQVVENSPLALGDETDSESGVYVATDTSHIRRLDAEGNSTWSASLQGEISQITVDTSVYVATTAGITAL